MTTFETIPPNNVVEWSQPVWQRASRGLWAHPYLADYVIGGGIDGSDPEVKILWWTATPLVGPLAIEVQSLSEPAYHATYSFEQPGVSRRDRPTGFETPPPGCYEIGVTIGRQRGTIVERVLP